MSSDPLIPPVPAASTSLPTVVDRLTDALIDAVVDGRFPPGSLLPPERELAQAFEVNRATLRQALGRLEQVGLVRRRQGSGTVVVDPLLATAPEVVARVARDDQLDLVVDLLEVREALAGLIGRRASAGLTPQYVGDLRDLCDAVGAATTARERQLLELAFFAVLVDAADNRAVRAMLRWVEDVYGSLPAGRAPAADPFRDAFADGRPIALGLLRIVKAAGVGPDALAEEVAGYARTSGARLLASARQSLGPAVTG
jgi:GntR family transcriptional regulator, transcriptional repressor for pyruvate dehydrogenase complex